MALTDRKFTLLLDHLIKVEGGHAVLPECERVLKFLAFQRTNESDYKLLDYADNEGRATLGLGISIEDLVNFKRMNIIGMCDDGRLPTRTPEVLRDFELVLPSSYGEQAVEDAKELVRVIQDEKSRNGQQTALITTNSQPKGKGGKCKGGKGKGQRNKSKSQCFNCGEIGHWAKDCKKEAQKFCAICQCNSGHATTDCPSNWAKELKACLVVLDTTASLVQAYAMFRS